MIPRGGQQRSRRVGIDLGATGARLVELSSAKTGCTVRGAISLRWDSEIDGAALSQSVIDSIATQISESARAAGLKTSRCVLSPPPAMVSTRIVRMPTQSDADLAVCAAIEGAAKLGIDSAPTQVAAVRAGAIQTSKDNASDEILFMGLNSDPLVALIRALQAKGITVLNVEPSFIGVSRIATSDFRRTVDENSVRIALDVGWTGTSVILLRGQNIAFYKRVAIGGSALALHAAERLGLELSAIEGIRRIRMSPSAAGQVETKVDRAIQATARPLLVELANEVNKCLRYYTVTFRGAKPERVILTGGQAREPMLSESLSDSLGMPTKVIDPRFAGFTKNGEEDFALLPAHCWAQACGLAMRGMPSLQSSTVPLAADDRRAA